MIIQKKGKKLSSVTGREENWRNIAEDSSKDVFYFYWLDNFLKLNLLQRERGNGHNHLG